MTMHQQHAPRFVAQVTFLLIIVGLGVLLLVFWPHTRTAPTVVAPEARATGDGTITGTVTLHSLCPVERIPPDPSCTSRPAAEDLSVLSSDGARVVATVSSNAAGVFSVNVPPGAYRLVSARAGPPICSSGLVQVTADNTVDAEVSCDAGVR